MGIIPDFTKKTGKGPGVRGRGPGMLRERIDVELLFRNRKNLPFQMEFMSVMLI